MQRPGRKTSKEPREILLRDRFGFKHLPSLGKAKPPYDSYQSGKDVLASPPALLCLPGCLPSTLGRAEVVANKPEETEIVQTEKEKTRTTPPPWKETAQVQKAFEC